MVNYQYNCCQWKASPFRHRTSTDAVPQVTPSSSPFGQLFVLSQTWLTSMQSPLCGQGHWCGAQVYLPTTKESVYSQCFNIAKEGRPWTSSVTWGMGCRTGSFLNLLPVGSWVTAQQLPQHILQITRKFYQREGTRVQSVVGQWQPFMTSAPPPPRGRGHCPVLKVSVDSSLLHTSPSYFESKRDQRYNHKGQIMKSACWWLCNTGTLQRKRAAHP